MNIIARLEFELTNYDIAVPHFYLYAPENSSLYNLHHPDYIIIIYNIINTSKHWKISELICNYFNQISITFQYIYGLSKQQEALPSMWMQEKNRVEVF